jgi:hypothetical protein
MFARTWLVSLDFFCFGIFGDFIPKGENVGPKQASGKLVVPKWEEASYV